MSLEERPDYKTLLLSMEARICATKSIGSLQQAVDSADGNYGKGPKVRFPKRDMNIGL